MFITRTCFHDVIRSLLYKEHVESNEDVPKIEPRREKIGLRGFRPVPTQTGLGNHWRWLEAWNFGFKKKRDCTICVAKTKTLISFAVTAKLICVFVFANAKIRFSHVAAHLISVSWMMSIRQWRYWINLKIEIPALSGRYFSNYLREVKSKDFLDQLLQ